MKGLKFIGDGGRGQISGKMDSGPRIEVGRVPGKTGVLDPGKMAGWMPAMLGESGPTRRFMLSKKGFGDEGAAGGREVFTLSLASDCDISLFEVSTFISGGAASPSFCK